MMKNHANIRNAARAIIDNDLSFEDLKRANLLQNSNDKLSDNEIIQALDLAEKVKPKRKLRKLGFVLSVILAPLALLGSVETSHLGSPFADLFFNEILKSGNVALSMFLFLCAAYFYWSYKNTP